jgi:hypothetical protein
MSRLLCSSVLWLSLNTERSTRNRTPQKLANAIPPGIS